LIFLVFYRSEWKGTVAKWGDASLLIAIRVNSGQSYVATSKLLTVKHTSCGCVSTNSAATTATAATTAATACGWATAR